MKKIVLYALLSAGLGAGIYLFNDEPVAKTQTRILLPDGTPLTPESFTQIAQERNELRDRVSALQDEVARVTREKLEVAQNPQAAGRVKNQDTSAGSATKSDSGDPFAKSVLALAGRAAELNQFFQKIPEKEIPELQFLTEGDWINLAKSANFDTDESIRQTLSEVRQQAKQNFAKSVWGAAAKFAESNNGQLPSDPSLLKPFFDVPIDDRTLQRYQVVPPGTHPELAPLGNWTITEINPVDPTYDPKFYIGSKGYWSQKDPAK